MPDFKLIVTFLYSQPRCGDYKSTHVKNPAKLLLCVLEQRVRIAEQGFQFFLQGFFPALLFGGFYSFFLFGFWVGPQGLFSRLGAWSRLVLILLVDGFKLLLQISFSVFQLIEAIQNLGIHMLRLFADSTVGATQFVQRLIVFSSVKLCFLSFDKIAHRHDYGAHLAKNFAGVFFFSAGAEKVIVHEDSDDEDGGKFEQGTDHVFDEW